MSVFKKDIMELLIETNVVPLNKIMRYNIFELDLITKELQEYHRFVLAANLETQIVICSEMLKTLKVVTDYKYNKIGRL